MDASISLLKATNGLMVRSSATTETLSERGRYDSLRCSSTVEAVAEAAVRVWQGAEAHLSVSNEEQDVGVAIIIEPFIKTIAAGHLANERRVSRKRSQWLCEYNLLVPRASVNVFRFAVKSVSPNIFTSELLCKTYDELHESLRIVAASSMRLKQRCHYEWVWDGRKLWIVQRDLEVELKGRPPGSEWIGKTSSDSVGALKILVPEPDAKGDWGKIECLRVFRACDLETANVFVLEDAGVIGNLFDGRISDELRTDLSRLIRQAIVIRTDVRKTVPLSSLLLPRTDALSAIQNAEDFLVNTSRLMRDAGLRENEFCFIIHRFISARSCALSLGRPGVQRARIDSTWGLPDGLLFYPHDSFEVETRKPNKIKHHNRCKTHYLDVDRTGRWVEKQCGKPWDWRQSLTRDELITIARSSYKVAEFLRRPVEIMYFVGVDPHSGHPSMLPWYYTTEIPTLREEAYETRFVGKRYIVSSETDLSELEKRIREQELGSKFNIWLRPTPEMLRSKKFIDEVANIAAENDVPVEIEGSILSHIYYVLTSSGVRVKCIDAFDPKLKREQFGKLVRDLIPVRIQSFGESTNTYRVTVDELIPLLKAKAVEEALEFYAEDDAGRAFEELADLLEVIESSCFVLDRSFDDLKLVAKAKREERGGFKEGVVLVETREVPLISSDSRTLFENGQSADAGRGSHWKAIMRETRAPKLRGKTVRVSLIPPDPTLLDKRIAIPLGERDEEIVITYGPKEVLLSVRPSTVRPDPRQLKLFAGQPDK